MDDNIEYLVFGGGDIDSSFEDNETIFIDISGSSDTKKKLTVSEIDNIYKNHKKKSINYVTEESEESEQNTQNESELETELESEAETEAEPEQKLEIESKSEPGELSFSIDQSLDTSDYSGDNIFNADNNLPI